MCDKNILLVTKESLELRYILIVNLGVVCGYCTCRSYSDLVRAGLSGDRIPVGPRFSMFVQTVPASHPPYCIMGTGYFSGLKPSASGAAHTLPSDAEVVDVLELGLRLPTVAARACHEVTFAFTWILLSV